MTAHNMILTKRIQLLVNSKDADQKREVWDTLFRWQRLCFRSANYVLTHQYVQDQIGEFFYINEGLKLKLSDIHKDPEGVLTTSRINTTYQLLSGYFKGFLPSDIYTNLNTALVQQYNNERAAYMAGEKTLPRFKKQIPIPIKGRSIKGLTLMENGRDYSFTLFKLPFRTYLGKQYHDRAFLMNAIATGQLNLCDSRIELKKGKIYLLAALPFAKKEPGKAAGRVAEVSLSVEHPLMVTIGDRTYSIGHKEEFLYRRLAIQAALQRKQRGATTCQGGHGYQRKLKSVTQLKEKEKNYVDTKLHEYSRRLVDLCVQHGAGTILLMEQTEKETLASEDAFLLRNWSFGSLRQKIAYKAEQKGIALVVE